MALTIGSAATPGSFFAHNAGNGMATRYTLAADARLTSFKFYANSTLPSAKVRGVLYAVGGGNPLTFETPEKTGIAVGWNEILLPNPLDLAAGDYYVGCYSNTTFQLGQAGSGDSYWWAMSYAGGTAGTFAGTASAVALSVQFVGDVLPVATRTRLGNDRTMLSTPQAGDKKEASRASLAFRTQFDVCRFFVAKPIATKARCCIYTAAGVNTPSALVHSSPEVTSVHEGWNEITVPPFTVDPGDYFVGLAQETGSLYIGQVSPGTGQNAWASDTYSDGLAASWGTNSGTSVAQIAVYFEGTPDNALSVSPTHVSPSGGATVTFNAIGGWLGATATVTVGGASVSATVVDANHGTFVAPLHASGAVTVSVTSNGNTLTATLTFDAVTPPADADAARYFLSSLSSVVLLETLEISHPNFSQTYWVVRNKTDGLQAMLENVAPYNGRVQAFDYYPLRIRAQGARDNLDAGLEVDLGDLGEIIPEEIDRLLAADSTEPPVVKYRTYRSDDLTRPLYGPIRYEMGPITMAKEGASFPAQAPSLNLSRTGATYDLSTFPMLRGCI